MQHADVVLQVIPCAGLPGAGPGLQHGAHPHGAHPHGARCWHWLAGAQLQRGSQLAQGLPHLHCRNITLQTMLISCHASSFCGHTYEHRVEPSAQSPHRVLLVRVVVAVAKFLVALLGDTKIPQE